MPNINQIAKLGMITTSIYFFVFIVETFINPFVAMEAFDKSSFIIELSTFKGFLKSPFFYFASAFSLFFICHHLKIKSAVKLKHANILINLIAITTLSLTLVSFLIFIIASSFLMFAN
jgi:hypothetical protein